MVLAIGLSSATARAGYVDISYSFGGTTITITSPIQLTITGVTGGATLRFSNADENRHPIASASATALSLMLNIPLTALGILAGTVMQSVINTVGTAHFNGMTAFPQLFATSVTAAGQMFSGAFQTHGLTGFLHCAATFHFMNSYNYVLLAQAAFCTMTVGIPLSQISMQYAITGAAVIPLP